MVDFIYGKEARIVTDLSSLQKEVKNVTNYS